ncbi:MAG: alpha/beta hydrolase [Phycisphaerae bacterium]
MREPAGYGPGQMPPLIVALHGTDETAEQMIEFWAARNMRIPPLIAAPQGVGPGWRESDTASIRAMFEHLEANVSYDAQRVLLTGFSAGGAMSFQLLYVESVSVTAVAALANYVPPWITGEQVKAKAQVPVFYAVGMADINHERMREGLQRLRAAGARIDLARPRIGHVLDSEVAQEAVDWFFDRCADQVGAALDRMAVTRLVADLPALDRMCEQRHWHEPSHVRRAEQLIGEIEAPGRLELVRARAFVAESRSVDAVELLQEVEGRFVAGPLAREAKTLRLHLESDPAVRRELADRLARRRAEQGLSMYANAQRLVVQGQFEEAAEQCRRIIDLYSETPAAERARTLLQLLENRKKQ